MLCACCQMFLCVPVVIDTYGIAFGTVPVVIDAPEIGFSILSKRTFRRISEERMGFLYGTSCRYGTTCIIGSVRVCVQCVLSVCLFVSVSVCLCVSVPSCPLVLLLLSLLFPNCISDVRFQTGGTD